MSLPEHETAQAVRAWLKEHGRTAPQNMVVSARCLIDYGDMGRAWRQLARMGLGGVQVLVLVAKAVNAAAEELSLPSPAQLTDDARRVRLAINELRTAIEQSRLPSAHATMVTSVRQVAGGEERLRFFLGWRDVSPRLDKIGHSISVLEVLDVSEHLLDKWDDPRRLRVVQRQRHDPRTLAFVRYLTLALKQECGTAMPATVARIASAVCRPDKPLGKPEVQSMMRGM